MEYLPPSFAPPLFRWQSKRAAHNSIMNVAVSNVPGTSRARHIGGAPVNEIYSIGILSSGSAFNMTVWSYVDQLDISILSDDRTFDDVHEATDAMIHGLGPKSAAPQGFPRSSGTVDTAMAPVSRRASPVSGSGACSPACRERPASLRGYGRRRRRRRVLAELCDHVDRIEDLGDDLGRQRQLGGKKTLKPEREPEADRAGFRPEAFCNPSRLANQLPRVRNSCDSWAPIDTIGTIGTRLRSRSARSRCGPRSRSCSRKRGPVGVVVAAREDQHQRARGSAFAAFSRLASMTPRRRSQSSSGPRKTP